MIGDLAGKRIAVVRLSAIGDVVHALPVVGSIRAAAPDAHITWLIEPAPHELVRQHAAVDEYVVLERTRRLRGYRRLRRLLRGRRFDLVLGLHTALKAGIAIALLDSPRKLGFDRARAPELHWRFVGEAIAPRPRGHAQDEMLEFLDHLGVPRRLEWGLAPAEVERARYADLLPADERPTVALVVASSDRVKDWPADRFATLADLLARRLGARCVLVGGRSPAEEAAAARIQALATHPPLDRRARDLRRLACLLEGVDAVVSPDSGPMHLAVALGTPTVALMGATNPKRSGPYRWRTLMVDGYGDPGEDYPASAPPRPGRTARIEVETVFARVERALRETRCTT